MSSLEDLEKAHRRVQDLRSSGARVTDRTFKAAMNRLMSLIRNASPEEVAAFDAWRRAQEGGLDDGGTVMRP